MANPCELGLWLYEKPIDNTLTQPKIDIAAVGECLVDFVSEQVADTLVLEGHPSGAPTNVLAMASNWVAQLR